MFILDDSDLNLEISKENFVSAVPLFDQGFMYMWAAARSTFGFNSGKVYYDVKVWGELGTVASSLCVNFLFTRLCVNVIFSCWKSAP